MPALDAILPPPPLPGPISKQIQHAGTPAHQIRQYIADRQISLTFGQMSDQS